MTFEPSGNRIMVQLEGTEEMSKGGIYIPEVAKERPQIAKVLATGPGRTYSDGKTFTRLPVEVKVGDRIVLGKYAGIGITVEGASYMILDADEVLGVLR